MTSDAAGGHGCTIARQRAADCIGWTGTRRSNHLVDAAASEIAAGHVDRARHFFADTARYLAPAERAAVDGAFASEDLNNGSGYERISPFAAQDSNGDCCAVGPYNWLLYGKDVNQVPFGYCTWQGRCYTLGVENIEMRSSVYSFPEVHYYHYIYYGSGDKPTITGMSGVMKQDVSNNPDPQVNEYSCPDGALPLGCGDESRNSPAGTDDYYYVQSDWTNEVAGYPNDTAQFQTRRWKVLSSSVADIPAYFNGG